jgi:hypothetical protein
MIGFIILSFRKDCRTLLAWIFGIQCDCRMSSGVGGPNAFEINNDSIHYQFTTSCRSFSNVLCLYAYDYVQSLLSKFKLPRLKCLIKVLDRYKSTTRPIYRFFLDMYSVIVASKALKY